MKTFTHSKVKGSTKVNPQQVIFELKHRVLLALNKLADRDTYLIGAEELQKIVESLTPDGVTAFLSCILDTGSDQKSAVRKECIRLMGTLASFHRGQIGPHIGKMINSIVKRLKDSDTVVRDACLETVGILASKMSICVGRSDEVFVLLVKPLFEALGEQNRHVQSGSALCLARIIDNTSNPPASILQRMLARTIKLLKNPHFMAKPALIELNRSVIQAGGAPTLNALSSVITSIEESLKNSDWTTRKAASAALGEIATCGGSLLGSFKTSIIRSLESCRFDKVKPVRDTVQQALHYWRNLPGSGTSEPSEAGSFIKESFGGVDECSELTSSSDHGWKDVTLEKVGADSSNKRIPISVTKTCNSYAAKPKNLKANDDWHIEIAVPKTNGMSLAGFHDEESEGSSVSKALEGTSGDVTSARDVGYEYVPMDDKQEECSSKSKCTAVSHDHDESSLVKTIVVNQRFGAEKLSSEQQAYMANLRDRKSVDSTVTYSISDDIGGGCCVQTANEMVSIRKQLLEIENKQTNLMDLLQVFTRSTMGSLSMIQTKVLSLEHVVDKIAQCLVNGGKDMDSMGTLRPLKNNHIVSSPRFSKTFSPRPSVDMPSRQPSLFSMKNKEAFDEKAHSSRTNIVNPVAETKSSRNLTRKSFVQTRKTDALFGSASAANARQSGSESDNRNGKQVLFCEADLESAYVQALGCNNDLVLIELLERTGPVIQSLSQKTVRGVFSILASHFVERRFMDSIIPWLQQVVELSMIHGPNCLDLSAKTRREFLSAMQEALNMEFSSPTDRRSFTHLAIKLHQLWDRKLS